jgi:hypothetical protein
MEQHDKEMHQIRHYHGTRLQVVCLTYVYLRDKKDKGFHSYKMNKELHSDLETQGNCLETMRADMETFKGGKATTGREEQFHCGMPGLHKGGNNLCQWKDLSQAEPREKVLKFVTDAL